MEDWKDGRVEGREDGKLEGRKIGRLEVDRGKAPITA
jgi:hypothetical protein